MTRPYDWNPMPHVLAVICPDCSGEARFEFAEGRTVDKAHRPWFRRSRSFDLQKVQWHGGQRYVFAIHYAGLKGPALDVIEDFPPGHSADDFRHSPHFLRSVTGRDGTLVCTSCHARRKHRLNWPCDAWFQIEYRGRVLWAFDRDMAVRLLAHIEGKLRARPGWQLLKVPSHFRTAKARSEVAKRLRSRLQPGARRSVAARPGRPKMRKVRRGV